MNNIIIFCFGIICLSICGYLIGWIIAEIVTQQRLKKKPKIYKPKLYTGSLRIKPYELMFYENIQGFMRLHHLDFIFILYGKEKELRFVVNDKTIAKKVRKLDSAIKRSSTNDLTLLTALAEIESEKRGINDNVVKLKDYIVNKLNKQ